MKALPKGLSLQDFKNLIVSDIQLHYEKSGDGYTCKLCKASVSYVSCAVSIHAAEFKMCAGGGEVKTIPLPYCPTCEEKPDDMRTCVHIPYFGEAPALDFSSIATVH